MLKIVRDRDISWCHGEISVHTSRSLKMARRIVALRDEDVVADTTLQWFVQRNWRALELFFYPAQPLESGLEFQMVVAVAFGNGRDDGNVVTLWTHVVRRGDDGDINV